MGRPGQSPGTLTPLPARHFPEPVSLSPSLAPSHSEALGLFGETPPPTLPLPGNSCGWMSGWEPSRGGGVRPREGDWREGGVRESAQGDLENTMEAARASVSPDVRWKRKTLTRTLPGQFPPKSRACGGGARAWRDRAAASPLLTREGKTAGRGGAVGWLRPLVTFPASAGRGPGPPGSGPPTWRARSAPRAHSPLAAAPRPLATTTGTARRAVTHRPPPSRPAPRGHSPAGGARRGGGAAGRGSNRGSPRASPSRPGPAPSGR